MKSKNIAVACLVLLGMTGCCHTVYRETCVEPEPVVVQRTVVVESHRPHYYRHRPYSPRPVVVVERREAFRPHHREWARREERAAEHRAGVRAHADVRTNNNVRFHAEASAR